MSSFIIISLVFKIYVNTLFILSDVNNLRSVLFNFEKRIHLKNINNSCKEYMEMHKIRDYQSEKIICP
jgi:hypothetical protein